MTCERGNLSRPLLAFIVDQYLSRNQFSQTQLSFRNEASSLFANGPPVQNMLTLEEMMNQYIRMKKQKIELYKEKVMVMLEKNRIQKLLQDMENAVDIFNARPSLSNVAAMITNSGLVSPIQNSNTTSPVASTRAVFTGQNTMCGLVPPIQNSNTTPPVASTRAVFTGQNTMSLPPNPMDNVNSSLPVIRIFDNKRKDRPAVVDGCAVSKKPRGRPPGKKNQVQGINMPLPCPSKVDFGSATTQSSVGNFAVRASHIPTNSLSRAHPTLCDTHDISPPTDISPIATCIGEVSAPSYNAISTKRVMVEPQEQMVCKEDNNDISTLETSKRDTTDKSMRALDVNSSHILENLDKSSSNEIPISDKEREDCAHVDFSGLDDWSKIDFSNFEIEDSFTNLSRDIEMQNQEFFDHPA